MKIKSIFSKPPVKASWILRKILPKKDALFLIGDFEEIYSDIRKKKGESYAWFWYWFQVIKNAPGFIKNSVYWKFFMLKNYFKIALRNILRQKVYSLINIGGLAIGISCCILILLWAQDEISYDRFHKNGDYICRVLQDVHLDQDVTWALTQGPLGPSLKEDIPEIIDYARFTSRIFRFKYKDKRFYEEVGFADSSLFKMFDFPLAKGDPQIALTNPKSIIISQEMAVKYFGNEEPLGKVLTADGIYDFVVTGVLAEIPQNSHLKLDFIIPLVFARQLDYSVDRWNNTQFTTYVMLKKDVPAARVEEKITRYLDDKPTLEKGTILRLQPLTRIHLYSNFEFDPFGRGDIRYIRIFSITALFVLLIACINFMNLATARSATRSREVGIRMEMGVKRSGLIRQFLSESMLFAFAGLFIAVLIVELILPIFNDLAGKKLKLLLSNDPLIFVAILGITIFTGFISGSYPAIFLSSLRPINVLKAKQEISSSKSFFRKALVVTQFVLSLIMIISTLIVYKQLDYIRDKKLGFNKENLMYFVIRGDFFEKYDALKNELLQHPKILSITRTRALPYYGIAFTNDNWHWKGKNPDEEVLMNGNFVGYDYFETFGIEIKEGRGFSKEFSKDQSEVVLNEAAVKRMGIDSPIGMELYNDDEKRIIVGVAKDYHFRSLHKRIEPLVLILSPESCRGLCVRIKSEDISSTIVFLEKKWNQIVPDYQFYYAFLDKRLERLYRTEQQVGKIFKYVTLLTIFIACLGLFGLTSFMAERRTKEIGIRKALGASVTQIFLLFSKEFTRLVLLANVIGWPLIYLTMRKWLQRFAYRTTISIDIFLLGGFLALMIAWLTISYQTIKAAKTNTADALRCE